MIVVDASIMVSILWTAEVHYEESRRWLAESLVASGAIAAPILILNEVAGAITRRTGDPALGHGAIQKIKVIPRFTLVAIDDDIGHLAATFAADLRLHGANATYVATADMGQYAM